MSLDLSKTNNSQRKSSFLDRKSLNASLFKQVHFNQENEDDDDFDMLLNEIGRDDNQKFVDLDKLQCILQLCEFSKPQCEKILQISLSKQNDKGLIPKEEIKKLLKKTPTVDNQDFSSDMMSDIFDFISSYDGTKKNFLDISTLQNFSNYCGIGLDKLEEEEMFKSLLTLINKNEKITKSEFLKLRTFL